MVSLALCQKAEGEVVNIGSGEEWSIGETAQLLCEIVDRKIDIVSDESRVRPAHSEVIRLLADNSKIRSLTGWKSQTSFKKGLKNTVEWISMNLDCFETDHYAK